MKDKMIHFVCTEDNKVLKIYNQFARAERLIGNGIHVMSYNPNVYPLIKTIKVGQILNRFKIEMFYK
jgi:hypothetical protein